MASAREDSDAQVRVAALRALRETTNAAVLPALVEALHQESSAVRAAAASALGKFPGTQSESVLLEALASDSASDVRRAAAESLGEFAAARTNALPAPGLINALQNDASPEVREAAASALNRIGGEEVVKALTALLETNAKAGCRWKPSADFISIAALNSRRCCSGC